MIRVIGTVLLHCALCLALPFPFPAGPVPTPVPVVPTPFPLNPAARPFAPGFNSPYYNYQGTGAGGPAVPIVSYSSEHGLDGTYDFSFSTADGKQAQESGYLKDAYIDNTGNPQGTQVVQGSYAYISPEGTPIEVSYVADENGFRPSGVHIPANGKGVLPVLDKTNKQILDPAYNRYNPLLNRNQYFNGQYNNGAFNGQYNRGYDPRYPFANPSRINPYYNNYNPYQINPQVKNTQEQAKKDTA